MLDWHLCQIRYRLEIMLLLLLLEILGRGILIIKIIRKIRIRRWYHSCQWFVQHYMESKKKINNGIFHCAPN